jgi:hypothetical protein
MIVPFPIAALRGALTADIVFWQLSYRHRIGMMARE